MKFHNTATAAIASLEVKPYQEMSGNEAVKKTLYKRHALAVQIYQ